MAKPKPNSGFTLIEILTILGLVALISSMMLWGMESYRGGSFRDERDTIVSVLQKARSQSISNLCFGSGCGSGKKHGVLFDFESGQYIIFQGSSYNPGDSSNNIIKQAYPISVASGSISEVVFDQLSGNASPAGSIILESSDGHSSEITINSQGRIAWTN